MDTNRGMTRKERIALISMSLFIFASGTNQYSVVGLLPSIARELQVSIPTTGILITGYSIASIIGTLLVIGWVKSKVPDKTKTIILILIFIVGNIVCSLAPTFSILLIGRFIAAISGGMFFVIATTIASRLVASNKKGTAISILFTGLTLATVLGVPMGTIIGDQIGWRFTFLTIGLIALLALLMNILFIPALNKLKENKVEFKSRLINNRMILSLLMTAFGFGGTFVIYTYLALILEDVSGFHSSVIGFILLFYGISVAAGNAVGGKIANHKTINGLVIIFVLQVFTLLSYSFTAPSQVLGLISLMGIGFFSFMMCSSVQIYSMSLADDHPKAKGTAVALNTAALHLGIVIGSFSGGIIIQKIGLLHTPWVGAVMVGFALIIALSNRQLDMRLSNNKSTIGGI